MTQIPDKHVETPESLSLFPVVEWETMRATFFPLEVPSPENVPVTAALVFARYEGQYAVGDITGRGWCIPGGRVEPGETPEECAHREAMEEIGATLAPLEPVGYYLFTRHADGGEMLAPTYIAEVREFAPLPPGTESRGVRLLSFHELPTHYFLWDALIEAVFRYVEAKSTRLPQEPL